MMNEKESNAEVLPARPTNNIGGPAGLMEGELHGTKMGKQANQTISGQYEAGTSGATCSNTQVLELKSSRLAGLHTPMPAVKRQLVGHDRDGTPERSGLPQSVRYGLTEESSDDDIAHPESGAKRSIGRHDDLSAGRHVISPQTPAIRRPDIKRARKSSTPRKAPAE